MSPSSEREFEIARKIDMLSARLKLDNDDVAEILRLMDFRLDTTDHDFLHRYVSWRMANPIAK
jgi:hypothetical protein